MKQDVSFYSPMETWVVYQVFGIYTLRGLLLLFTSGSEVIMAARTIYLSRGELFPWQDELGELTREEGRTKGAQADDTNKAIESHEKFSATTRKQIAANKNR